MKVRVQAGAPKEKVERLGTSFVMSVREPAEQNRANIRVRELLARELMISIAAIRLVAGHKRPNKTFEILGLMPERIRTGQ